MAKVINRGLAQADHPIFKEGVTFYTQNRQNRPAPKPAEFIGPHKPLPDIALLDFEEDD